MLRQQGPSRENLRAVHCDGLVSDGPFKNPQLYERKQKAGKLNLVYESDSKILQVLNNVMQTRFNHGYYFDEVAGKKIKYFEALDVRVPGAGPETPEEVPEEPETEPLLGTDIEI